MAGFAPASRLACRSHAAAERLGCAKSVVSRRITELETRLGAQLLQRTTRRLSLTEAGRTLYRRGVPILEALDEAEQSVASGQLALTGRLRLAALLSFGLLHLVPALNAFMEEHPGLVLDLDLNDRRVDLVEEGMDLAVRIGDLTDSSLVSRALVPIRMLACASPAYLALHGRPQTPQDLGDHQGLGYSNQERPEQWGFQDAAGRDHRVNVPLRMCANNGSILVETAAAGLGICISPSFVCYRALMEGRMEAILSDYRIPGTTAYAVYPTRRFVPQRVQALIDFLKHRLGDTPYWDLGLPFPGPTSLRQPNTDEG